MIGTFLLLSFAAHRLWALWFGAEIVRPLRERMMQRGGRLAYLAGCQFCVSVWAGAAAVGIYALPYGEWGVLALAAGNLVTFLDRFYRMFLTLENFVNGVLMVLRQVYEQAEMAKAMQKPPQGQARK